MELCKETLGDFLRKREKIMAKKKSYNDLINQSTNLFKEEKMNEYLSIFKSIIKALIYIHNENLIHRDLKPSNIFICDDGKIKVGDFGLVTSLNSSVSTLDPSPISKKSIKKFCFNEERENVNMTNNYLTKNVGTLKYASPEQLVNNFYDQKTDIYSLGLILLELVLPIKTEMERNTLFIEIKEKNEIPKNLKLAYPQISEILLKMVNSDPKTRPSACELLSFFNLITSSKEENEISENLKNNNYKINNSNLTIKINDSHYHSESCENKKQSSIISPIYTGRKRFLSEDILGVKSQEFIMKISNSENRNWKKM